MKTSVALCTYNGEDFIREQLDSILQQTVPVDEIVICDDGSSDSTLSILNQYDINNPGIFQIFRNDKNLRSVKNFEKAITLCKNDIIFLSDQDDFWVPQKVETMLASFRKNPHISVLCSNGYGINQKGEALDVITIWDVPQFLKESGIPVDYFKIISYVGNIATGATMAIRKDFTSEILPFPQKKGFHHDEWIALVASYHNQFDLLNERLIKYRTHDNQQVGGVFYPNNQSTRKQLIRFFNLFGEHKNFAAYKKLLKRLTEANEKIRGFRENGIEHPLLNHQEKDLRQVYSDIKAKFRTEYPVRYLLLFCMDKVTGKRQMQS
ncbi:glycosyltransferase family 2 protein [Chryseobacterium sp. MFBS3-17]|uniref:glycosyltransferase family 2 protein n=1 Tax=Chryseobacterium sp. MFBS3-17 TaxID=2886689 RepID=UPI001D0F0A1D|nr:glycosyltransferase family 2 protein [Chryseobacterium sp. MFBS3-17]MCC2589679.1 glycosyltransferase family 2 protein [Chryseobacterium sp. MFBS3-17]